MTKTQGVKIQLTLTVRRVTPEDARDFANDLAVHILDTFNDDASIGPVIDVKVLSKKGGAIL